MRAGGYRWICNGPAERDDAERERDLRIASLAHRRCKSFRIARKAQGMACATEVRLEGIFFGMVQTITYGRFRRLTAKQRAFALQWSGLSELPPLPDVPPPAPLPLKPPGRK